MRPARIITITHLVDLLVGDQFPYRRYGKTEPDVMLEITNLRSSFTPMTKNAAGEGVPGRLTPSVTVKVIALLPNYDPYDQGLTDSLGKSYDLAYTNIMRCIGEGLSVVRRSYTDTELLNWCEERKLSPGGPCMDGLFHISSESNRVSWGRGGNTIREAITSAIEIGPRS